MIVRGERPADNFAQIHNAALADGRLSFKARGILAYLLSRPPGWKTSADRLSQSGRDGERAIKSGLKELEEFGYLNRTRSHKPDGTWEHNQVVTDQPAIGAKQPDGEAGLPTDGTIGTLCTGGKQPDINNTELNNTYLSSAVVEDGGPSPTGDGPQPPSSRNLEPPRDAGGGWEPSPAALVTAEKNITHEDIQLSIVKYRIRAAELKREPSSSEWLRWLIEDEKKARKEALESAVEKRRKRRWDEVAQ